MRSSLSHFSHIVGYRALIASSMELLLSSQIGGELMVDLLGDVFLFFLLVLLLLIFKSTGIC